ncbi:MAG: hypothetical protein IJ423_05590 [Clostridia bacterium]|nr:hypothetical protein [Clostridia bacterium]MBQ8637443.1 hypothetical protein [Clostridia bacterium]
MERQPNTEYVLSLSYGKDSIACIEAIYQLGLPLDRIIHAEVWATDTIPAGLPPMVEFKKYADQVIKFRYGIDVEHIYATREREREKNSPTKSNSIQSDLTENTTPTKYTDFLVCEDNGVPHDLKQMPLTNAEKLTYEKMFYQIPNRKTQINQGKIKGFPGLLNARWCGKLKVKCFRKAPLHKEQVQILCSTSE